MSANLCEALAGLTRIGRGIHIQLSWASAQAKPEGIQDRFDIPVDSIVHLETAARWFRQSATVEEAEFFGSIQKLEKIDEDTDLITIVGTINEEHRSVRVPIQGNWRILTARAYHDRSPIIGVGDLTKEGNSYYLRNLRAFQIVNGE